MTHTKLSLTILLLAMLMACTEQLTPEQQAYMEYCFSHNGAWMKMNELKDGKIIGPPCFGCMPDEKNHICTLEEYKTWDIQFRGNI